MKNPVIQWAWLGRMPYAKAWELQGIIAAQRRAGSLPDMLLLVEHQPVYTMGRNGSAKHLLASVEQLREFGADYVDVDRGGSVTFHGPGQLVAYPIIDLTSCFPMTSDPRSGDVIAYVRALEDAHIQHVHHLGIETVRREGYTGVWFGNDKLVAIGIKLAHGITQHGTALNVNTDLSWFAKVIPCGIHDGGVTSLAALGVQTSVEEQCEALATQIATACGLRPQRATEGELQDVLARLYVHNH